MRRVFWLFPCAGRVGCRIEGPSQIDGRRLVLPGSGVGSKRPQKREAQQEAICGGHAWFHACKSQPNCPSKQLRLCSASWKLVNASGCLSSSEQSLSRNRWSSFWAAYVSEAVQKLWPLGAALSPNP